MKIDTATSTVIIAGRRFPAVCMVCPPVEGDTDPEWEHLLGGPSVGVGPREGKLSYQAMIPCENGVLVVIEWEEDSFTYSINLDARTCYLYQGDPLGEMWLPHLVGVQDGHLFAHGNHSAWFWHHAEPDWTVEHIDRISAMPFIQPEGPAARLISLAEAEELHGQATYS